MKQLTTAIALICAFITPISFAASSNEQTPSRCATTIPLDFAATYQEPTIIPIDTNQRDVTVAVTVSRDYYCFDDKCDNARVQVLWNDQVVPGCDAIKPGSSTIFHLNGSGTLTIKNLTTDSYTSSWDNQVYPSVAYGYISINLE